jgi:DNA-binding XRE family transcriptional regulator
MIILPFESSNIIYYFINSKFKYQIYWVDYDLSLRHFSKVINNRDKGILDKFGNHLRELRLTKKLSQQDLELKAEISKNQVGNIERGEVNITLITATAIAKALDVPLKVLYDY